MPYKKNTMYLEINDIQSEEISFTDEADKQRKIDSFKQAYRLTKGMNYLFFTKADSKMNKKSVLK